MQPHAAVSDVPPSGHVALGAIGADDETGALSGLRVLVVEDEVLIGLELQDALERAGAEVFYATSLKRGLAAAGAEEIDAGVLDVNLGGGHTCAPIAQALRGRGVPFLLHSGDLNRLGEVISDIDAPVVPKPIPSGRLIEKLVEIARK